MVKRIVRMVFSPGEIETFKGIFAETSEQIRASEGCEYLELVQDVLDQRIFFTISHWKDEESLNNYRRSDLFKATWQSTKVLFEERAGAWSTQTLHKLD